MSAKPITQPKQLLVEGKDEVNFFEEFISILNLENIKVRDIGGKTRLADRLEALWTGAGHEVIASIGIVRDADRDPNGAFDSICGALQTVGLPTPAAPLQCVGDIPRVTVMIVPDEGEEGMLETLCLESVADDPAMLCVEEYFECLENQIALEEFPCNPAKAKVRAFLTTREWVEEAYFECVQEYLENHPPVDPIVEQAHIFLASRYKPDLDLGVAARAGYWPFDHPAFAKVREFLGML